MNKSDLIEKMAEGAEISKVSAGKAFDALIAAIGGSLAAGDSVTVVGFGTWKVSARKARKGRNPQTGKEIKIAASKAATFKAGAKLKALVNGAKAKKADKKSAKAAVKKK